jgi:hypothetical protein
VNGGSNATGSIKATIWLDFTDCKRCSTCSRVTQVDMKHSDHFEVVSHGAVLTEQAGGTFGGANRRKSVD